MVRRSAINKQAYGRELTTFPPAVNKLLVEGKEHRLKILTDPRIVKIGYRRRAPICEVDYQGKRYTLYASWADLSNSIAILDDRLAERGDSLKGKIIVLKRKGHKFEVRMAQ